MKVFTMGRIGKLAVFCCALPALFLWIGTASAALSADDFLPPVQAEGEERNALLVVKDAASVKTAPDPVLGLEVTTAPNLQDALNKIAEKPKAGCHIIAEPGGGYAFAATGQDSYYSKGQTVTMERIGKRNAYLIAFMNAKAEMAKTVGEIVVRGATNFNSKIETLDAQGVELRNLETELSEEQLQSVRKVLKGYVTYSVKDTLNEDGGTVHVTIVSSSKTRGNFNRTGADGVTAASLREGLNSVIAEIKNGLIPPVGGRIIEVPGSGEVAFVGFGSSVVRHDRDADVREDLKLQAERRAAMLATDALTGIILGDDVSWQARTNNEEKEQIEDFHRLQATDQTARDSTAEIQVNAERKREIRDTSLEEVQIRSLRQGVLPPGVMRETSLDEDETFAYGIAVYIPSVSGAVRNAAREMDEAQLVQPPKTDVKSDIRSEGVSSGSTGDRQTQTPEARPRLKQGPTGVVEQPL